jgi:4-hydroxy-tetrahydrodipicolinate synthase
MVKFKDSRLENVKVIVPLSTPLTDGEELDFHGLERLVNHVIGGRADGVFILGSCGEGPFFEFNDFENVIKKTKSYIDGRVPLFVGVGRDDTAKTVKLAKLAKDLGADYAVVLPPTYFKTTDKELLEHYKAVNDVGIPIVLYNLNKTNSLNADLVRELERLENVVAIKDGSGDLEQIERIAEILPTYQGDDALIFDSLERGAVGCVPGLGNIFPNWFRDFVKTYRDDNREESRRIQDRIKEAQKVIYFTPSNPQVGVKLGLESLGICGARMKSPNGQADEESREIISDFIKSI